MRVLILTQYFPPEIGATQTRLHTFAASLSDRGHEVEVICEVPNHPQGIVHDGYRGRPVVRRRLDGFVATYVWVHVRPVKSRWGRLGFYASYTAMATAVGSLCRRPDVILATSPPLPVAVAGATLARRHRVPWVMDVRDLWPAAAVAMGELGEGRSLQLASQLERWLYRDATAIAVVTKPFIHRVNAMIDEEKVHLVPNGTTRFWLDADQIDPDRDALKLDPEAFIWTYAGNVSGAQGLESAVRAADLLGPEFELLVVGDGPARADLENLAAVSARANVTFRGQVPKEQAREYLRASDALLVSLSDDPAFRDFVPSKLWDFCAVGRPVILAVEGEAARLAGAEGAALCIPSGDPAGLAAAVRRLRDHPDLRSNLAEQGRRVAAQNLRTEYLDTLESVLGSLARTRSRGD